MNPYGVVWTPLMGARLMQMIHDDVPYLEIARAMSAEFKVKLTKNACIGKGRRLHAPLRIAPRKRTCLKRSVPRKKPGLLSLLSSAAKNWRQEQRKRKLKAHPLRHRRQRRQQQPLRNLSLLQLRPRSCRFPTGHSPPYSYCGAHAQDGSSYCPEHHAMTHYRSRS